ncbi:hypothetical protein, partial [Clavibacter michiganensis]|uniref:hypothetical protein n=1 Tax=Clavibacter michiganensis TaxID=28447 RepID=UPI0029306520
DLESDIAISLAGRTAEQLILGTASTGSDADLAIATQTLAALHGSFGLGASLTRRIDPQYAMQLLSDSTFRELIETELRKIEGRTFRILNSRRFQLCAVADALRSKRVLGADEFAEFVGS